MCSLGQYLINHVGNSFGYYTRIISTTIQQLVHLRATIIKINNKTNRFVSFKKKDWF